MKTYVRNGIKIVVSREAFPIESQVGYQKPKPRVFIQPDPKPAKEYYKEERGRPARSEDLRPRVEPAASAADAKKGPKVKAARQPNQSNDAKPEKANAPKDRQVPQARNPPAQKQKARKGRAPDDAIDQQDFWSDFDPYHQARQPYSGARGARGRRVAYHYGEPDEHVPVVRRGGYPPRQRAPVVYPQEEMYVARRGRGAYKFYKPGSRGHMPNYYEEEAEYRPVYMPREHFERMPQRPGFYAGNRPFGTDQKRDPKPEKSAEGGQKKAKPASAVRNQRKGPNAAAASKQ